MFRASCTKARTASLCARVAQRQRAQVDGSGVGACHRRGLPPSVSAFHNRRSMGCGSRLATPPGVAPGTRRHRDLRRTSFPKQGTHSVGVARQCCGTLGKLANYQVAVTAALWTRARAYMLGAVLYLPEEWLTD